MGAQNAIPPSPACPDAEELTAFTRGQLPEARLETIADHLTVCTSCASTLHAVQVMDELVQQLRRDPPELVHEHEPACAQLADHACAIPQEQKGLSTVPDAKADHRTSGPSLPAEFGAYVLLQWLGEGGMGVVYKAKEKAIQLVVAIKRVRAGIYASAEERARFHRDACALARIQHPNVVQIYGYGEHEGQLYFSMELLPGGTLADRLKSQPMSPREAAELVRTLARAVAEVHRMGIWHRDLKPGNVMFAADGTVKITDFGLAKLQDDENDPTRSNVIMGTAAYMSPEQAHGENAQIGAATDVYGLGTILYQTLTGRPPFQAKDAFVILERVRNQEPEAPKRWCPKLARDLEAICLKCLEKNPEMRYRSAAALADDLERWLRGETTEARPRTWLIRQWRRVRRHPRLVWATVLLLLSAIAVLAYLYLSDPDRPVKNLERRLRRGEMVTLIGESGPPTWSHWELRQGAIDTSPWGDNTYTINALEPALLTLIRDPQGCYKFSARVRHGDSSHLSEVGLFFVYSQHNTQKGANHCFCNLVFSDREALSEDQQTGAPCARVSCNLWRSDLGSNSGGLLADHYFRPAVLDENKYPWRELAVEVHPEGLELFWEGKSFARVPHATILEYFQPRKLLRANLQMVDAYPDLQPAFTPRDALGLYVNQGRASYQHVVVQPLP